MTATFHVGDAIECDCVEGCQLADRFTPATREILILTKSAKRFFDLDAVREPHLRWPREPEAGMYREGAPPGGDNKKVKGTLMNGAGNPAGAPPAGLVESAVGPSPRPAPPGNGSQKGVPGMWGTVEKDRRS